jgi:hypothetical protein
MRRRYPPWTLVAVVIAGVSGIVIYSMVLYS